MNAIKLALLCVTLSLAIVACDDNSQVAAPGQNEAVINGTVVDASVSPPAAVAGASVSAGSNTATTNDQGQFTLRIANVESITDVALLIVKAGYRDTTVFVTVQPQQEVKPTIAVTPRSVISGGSRVPKTIAFLGANPREISVYGVGGIETAILGWEVRDSLGRPLDTDNAVDLTFRLVNGPGGGEYVSPTTRRSDASGQAYITFSSGTKSGVVQVVASTVVGSATINSYPVRVVINGGFPVQSHFSIAPAHYNFAALNWLGRTLDIVVLLGDVYSNPVAPGTAVYFKSGAGVIQPSVFTNKDGQGFVQLISGNPLPSTGYHWVVARTIGQDGVAVTDSIRLLWSGLSQISALSPTSFAIPNGGSQSFTFTVSDQLGHPLSPGTRISVGATVPPPPDPNTPVNQVQVAFGLSGSIVLRDYLNPGSGTTDFGFTISDGTTNIDQATSVIVTVSVQSENGDVVYTFSGTAR